MRSTDRRGGRALSVGLLTAAVAACVHVPPDAGFDDVTERAGAHLAQRVHWFRGGDEDREVRESVDALLDQPLTEDAVVQIALLRHHGLQAVYQELGIAQAALVQAGLLRNPIFEVELLFEGGGHQADVELSVIEDFLSILNIPLRKAVKRAEFEAAKVRVEGAILEHAGRARLAFVRTQAHAERVRVLEREVEAAAAASEGMRRLHEAGNVTPLDLYQSQDQFNRSKLSLAAAEAAAEGAREELNRAMGLWGEDLDWTLAATLDDVPEASPELDGELDGLEGRVVEASLDLALPRAEIEALAHTLGLVRSTAWFDDLELGAKAERSEGEWELGPVLEVNVPLFDQGQARKAAAGARLRQREEEYAAAAVELRSMARLLRARYVAGQRRARFIGAEVLPLRERILRETLLRYNAMQIGMFQLLAEKRRELGLQLEYVDALEAYWVARVELETLLAGKLLSETGGPGGGVAGGMGSSQDMGAGDAGNGGH